jgi:SAM-dependent methyltransferase
VDGAASMIEMAKSRLGSLSKRADFRIGDFRYLAKLVRVSKPLDLIYSAYALHHLTSQEKLAVLRDVMGLLKPGGWFLNADLTVAADKLTEARIQEMRVSGIVHRAGGRDQRFLTASSTRAFLDDREARDNDKPLTLMADLKILREAGFGQPVRLLDGESRSHSRRIQVLSLGEKLRAGVAARSAKGWMVSPVFFPTLTFALA